MAWEWVSIAPSGRTKEYRPQLGTLEGLVKVDCRQPGSEVSGLVEVWGMGTYVEGAEGGDEREGVGEVVHVVINQNQVFDATPAIHVTGELHQRVLADV